MSLEQKNQYDNIYALMDKVDYSLFCAGIYLLATIIESINQIKKTEELQWNLL